MVKKVARWRIGQLLLAALLLCVSWLWWSTPLEAATLPLASTVDMADAPPGSVVVFDEQTNTYSLSTSDDSPFVYGVVTVRPAIVLVTSSTSPAVTTQGVVSLLVDASGGRIVRGDVLTTGTTLGVARKARAEDQYAFAIALEGYEGTTSELIQVEVNATKAQALVAATKQATETDAAEVGASWLRISLAVLTILLGVGFLLWSYRTLFVSGITSIGRNPRAKQAVLLTTIGGTILGVILIVVVVFIALGILVLPIA